MAQTSIDEGSTETNTEESVKAVLTDWAQQSMDQISADDEEFSVQQKGFSKRKVRLLEIKREKLEKHIYKYTFILKVGNGKYDQIGIYRVVKEKNFCQPIKSPTAVFLVHGVGFNFDLSFLPSAYLTDHPDVSSMGIYLANNNIDVWGIDLRWTFIDREETNLELMKDWNVDFLLKDIKYAVKFARFVRGLTGSGFGKIFLGGHHTAGVYPWAYANSETMLKQQK
ncbi:MAG: hypothetical protein MJB14_11140, partial [Spirochaetes bacterium]|nr:hypothetical protein [Spirochaetota bacterium]